MSTELTNAYRHDRLRVYLREEPSIEERLLLPHWKAISDRERAVGKKLASWDKSWRDIRSKQIEHPATSSKDTKTVSSPVITHPDAGAHGVLNSDGYARASSSDKSSTTARGVIEARKEKIIGKILLAITQKLQYQFTRAHTSAREATSGSHEGGNTTSTIPTQFPNDQAKRRGKRKLGSGDDDGWEDNDDDTTDRSMHSGANDRKGKGKELPRFACPYFKYNPTKYQHSPGCPGPGWPDVHRTKEHLYSKHRQPFSCARCWACFDSDQGLAKHLRAKILCKVEEEKPPIEGFDANQEKQLRCRKKKSHIVSEVDKWRAVFQILFPDVLSDNIPSPFYEYEQLASEALPKFEEYIIREFPSRLREILDRPQIVEQDLMTQTIESANGLLQSLFQEYRAPPVPEMTLMPSGSQDPVGASSSQVQPSWPSFTEEMFPDCVPFDMNSLLAADGNPLDDIQGIPPTDPGNYTPEQFDFPYQFDNEE